MSDTLGKRIFLAHLELSIRLGRRITLDEFGEMIARRMRRDLPFTGPAVSRWESDAQTPALEVIEAIAAITSTDPGWLSHGKRSAAPQPPRPSLHRNNAASRGDLRTSIVITPGERADDKLGARRRGGH